VRPKEACVISVVIPAYNEEKYLPKCLDSLRRQAFPSSQFEIIVADNGSTDRTIQIALDYGATVVHEEVKGVARARQRGFAAAEGEIIASTDADAIVPPDWLATIARIFDADPTLGGVTGPVYFYDGTWLDRWYYRHVNTNFVWVTFLIRRGCFSGNNFAVRREPFFAVNGFDLKMLSAEDADLALRMRKKTKTRFRRELVLSVSARRARQGYWKTLTHAAIVYFQLFLGLPTRGFDDIR